MLLRPHRRMAWSSLPAGIAAGASTTSWTSTTHPRVPGPPRPCHRHVRIHRRPRRATRSFSPVGQTAKIGIATWWTSTTRPRIYGPRRPFRSQAISSHRRPRRAIRSFLPVGSLAVSTASIATWWTSTTRPAELVHHEPVTSTHSSIGHLGGRPGLFRRRAPRQYTTKQRRGHLQHVHEHMVHREPLAATFYLAATSAGNQVFFAGGLTAPAASATSWTSTTRPRTHGLPRASRRRVHGLAAASVGNKVLFAGGRPSAAASKAT